MASMFFEAKARERNVNLADVSNRILSSYLDTDRKEEHRAAILDLYGKVLNTRMRVADDDTSRLVAVLKLSGITTSVQSELRVRNRIYERVFDKGWIERSMPDAELRRQRAAYRSGMLRVVSAAGFIVLVMTSLAAWAISNANKAAATEKEAIRDRNRAISAEAIANKSASDRAAAESEARKSAATATRSAAEAEKRRRQAEEATKRADLNFQLAETRLRAVNNAQKATVAEKQVAVLAEGRARAQAVAAKRLAFESYGANMVMAANELDADNATLATQIVEAQKSQPRRGFEYGYLTKQLNQAASSLLATGNVYGVAYSPDGRRAYTTGGTSVHEWDLGSGKLVRQLPGLAGSCFRVVCSPDGRWLVATGLNGDIGLWDRSSGSLAHLLKGHKDAALGAAFSPDSRHIATTGQDGTVRLWDVQSGQQLHLVSSFLPNGFLRRDIAFSPDGRLLATSSSASSCGLWNAETLAMAHTLNGHSAAVTSVAFSVDGGTLVTGSYDRTVKAWNVATGECIKTFKGFRETVNDVAISPNGDIVAAAGVDATVRLWSLQTGDEVRRLRTPSQVYSVAFSPDGKYCMSGGENGAVSQYAVHVPSSTLDVRGAALTLVASDIASDGRTAATADPTGMVTLWNLQTGHEIRSRIINGGRITSIVFSRDGSRLAVCSRFAGVHLLDLPGLKETGVFLGSFAAFSRDGKLLVTGTGNLAVVWDLTTGKKRLSLAEERGVNFMGAVFSPDGSRLLTGSESSYPAVWEVRTGRELFSMGLQHTNSVASVDWSADGKLLATGSFDKTAIIWDVRNGKPLQLLKGHLSGVKVVQFSPDSRQIVTGSDDGTARLWDVETGVQVLSLKAGEHGVTCAAFSADGGELLTSGYDNSARVWRAVTMHELAATEAAKAAAATREAAEKRRIEEAARRAAAARFAEVRRRVIPRSALATSAQIDLSRQFNALPTESWHDPSNIGNNLSALQVGLQTLAGARFDIRGVVQVASANTESFLRGFPRRIDRIPVHRACRKLAFLMGAGWIDPDGVQIGQFVLHYTDGQTKILPIIYGRDVRDWWNSQAITSGSTVAWTGENVATRAEHSKIRLFKNVRDNPLPGARIETIDFVSTMQGSAPFLLAITLE